MNTLPVKCLLVDDVEDNLVVLSALLRQEGVDLLPARSGPEALELLLTHDVALAVLDVQMPEMDGFELAELMRGSERTRQVPIIFVTAGARDQHRLFKGYELGAVDFLYKPIDAHVLRNKTEVFFRLHRQQQLLVRDLRERTETLRLNEMFAAVLGHDLRNPLNAVVTSAQVIQRCSVDPTVRDAAGRILSSGRRMGRMIDDLLDLARARLAGGIPLKREAMDLRPVVERVIEEHAASHPDRRILVTGEGDLTGCWDPDRLSQVASNLIGNALKHGDGNEPVRVELDGTQTDVVVLSVTNGGYIRPEVLPYVFDPFRGARPEQHHRDGLGLGLYITQQIALAHRGRVEVESAPARGTVFRVTMPRR